MQTGILLRKLQRYLEVNLKFIERKKVFNHILEVWATLCSRLTGTQTAAAAKKARHERPAIGID